MHTLKYAFRFLSRQKLFTGIIILGLALSLACSIILGRFLYRELTVDRHAIHPETMYVAFRQSPHTHRTFDLRWTKEQYDKAGKEYIDQQIVESCTIHPYPQESALVKGIQQSCRMIMVDSLFTHFFDYPLLGDAAAFSKQNGCWISEECARSFGLTPEEALGTDIEVMKQTLHIAGVFHNPEGQVILDPDLILPASSFGQLSRIPFGVMRVRSDFDAEAFNQQLTTFGETESHEMMWGDPFLGHEFVNWNDYYFAHETGEVSNAKSLRHHGNADLCWILSAVLLLILVVGVVNFINLYMVLWQRRQREAGVRRVFGRQTLQLFLDLWCELLLLTLAALFVAWLFVELSASQVETLLGNMQVGSSFDIWLTVGIALLLPLLTLLYPFVQQLRTSPLKNLQQRTGSVQSLKARTGLLGFLYFITLSLVVMALWMRQHLDFLLNTPIGFDAEKVLLVRPVFFNEFFGTDASGNFFYQSNRDEVKSMLEEYTNRLKQSPLVETFCYATESNLPLNTWRNDKYFNGRNESCYLLTFGVSRSWFDVFDIKLVEGSFPVVRSYSGDSWYERVEQLKTQGMIDGWIANRSALKQLGYQSLDGAYARLENALIIAGDGQYGNEEYPIKALLNDHYAQHRTLGATACIYYLQEEEEANYWSDESYLAIRVRSKEENTLTAEEKASMMTFIESLQGELFPNNRLESLWMHDRVEEQYHADRVMADVYTLFSSIAVIISCLGLLGLSLFDIRQRFREIAIRKANGAHRRDIYLRLGLKYLYTLLATFVLSIPVTYLLIHRYTESLVEFAPLTPWIYLEALGIVTLITLLTLLYQLEKASRVNVAEIVKSE